MRKRSLMSESSQIKTIGKGRDRGNKDSTLCLKGQRRPRLTCSSARNTGTLLVRSLPALRPTSTCWPPGSMLVTMLLVPEDRYLQLLSCNFPPSSSISQDSWLHITHWLLDSLGSSQIAWLQASPCHYRRGVLEEVVGRRESLNKI